MKRAILASVLVFVLLGAVSAYGVSWILQEDGCPGSNSITPDNPTTSDVIYFSYPTSTFPNWCAAEIQMGGTPTLNIDHVNKTIEIFFEPPPPTICPLLWEPVCGLEGSFGPLESGTWSFEDISFEVVDEDEDVDEDTCDLPEALDTTTLSFITGGNADWFCQTSTSYYDGDAAESGGIWNNQESWMQTTVDGPGTLSFYWKVSSQSSYDFLEFYIDSVRKDRISGLMSWQQMSYDIITLGSHTLEWRYFKNGNVSSGSDCGWVDKVEWVHRPDVCCVEDFETGDFSKFLWEHYGDATWSITSQEKYSGTYSAQAGYIEDDGSTTLQVTLDCVSGNITFCRKVSSKFAWDYLKFYIDGDEKDKWSGEQDWAEVSFPVTAGLRTFEWTYSKDSSVSKGDDTAWIDDIVFPVVCGYDPNLIVVDNFEDGVIDSFWNTSLDCPGSEIREANGKLTINIPSWQTEDCSSGLVSARSYLCQSFEASVDFRVPKGASGVMAWLSASSPFDDGDIYGVYLYLGSDYNIWYRNQQGYGWESGRSAFGDENIAWHRLKLFYDGDTKTLTSYVDNIFLNSKYVDLINVEIGISAKVFANMPATTIEFDNFCLVVYGTDLYDDGEEHRSFSPQEVIEGEPGQNFEIKCHVRNGGDYDSGPFTVKFYASRDQRIVGGGRGEYYIGEKSIPGIPAGGLASCLWNGDFPTSIPSDNYYVGWIIDADNEVNEINEDNNTAYKEEYQLTVVPQ